MSAQMQELIGRQYNQGTTVINCVKHMSMSLLERPKDCNLCNFDVSNHLSRCIGTNEFLNKWKDDATKVFDELMKR